MFEDGLKLKSGRPAHISSIRVEDFLYQRYHYFPVLITEIQNQTGASVEDIKESLWEFYKKHENNGVTLQKTSAFLQTGNTRGGRVEKRRLRFLLSRNGWLFGWFLLTKPIGRFKG